MTTTHPLIHAAAEAIRRSDPSIGEWQSFDLVRAVIGVLADQLDGAATVLDGHDYTDDAATLRAIAAHRPLVFYGGPADGKTYPRGTAPTVEVPWMRPDGLWHAVYVHRNGRLEYERARPPEA